MRVRSLGWEDPLEKRMATHSSILALRILWTEDASGIVFSVCVCVCAQLCPTLYDPMECSPPGSSVHGISQVKILKNESPFPPPRDLPDPGIKPASPASAGRFCTTAPWRKTFIFYVSILSFWFVVAMRFFYGNLYVLSSVLS